jgi:hypothetical protein
MTAPFRPRYVAPAQKPEPKPLSRISRPQLAARVHQLRQALNLLWSQSEADGCEPYAIVGRAKAELIDLEERLREFDRQAARGEPLPLPVAFAIAMRRVGE